MATQPVDKGPSYSEMFEDNPLLQLEFESMVAQVVMNIFKAGDSMVKEAGEKYRAEDDDEDEDEDAL